MTPYNQFFAGHDGNALEIVNAATSGAYHPAEWFYDWATGGMGKSDAGVVVNGYTSLTWCPLWQAVNIIAGDLGQVPFRLVKDEFYDQNQHNAWQLLNIRPNDLQSPSVFIETMVQWMLVWGNAVAWTPRIGSRITDLIPLRPDCIRPELIAFDGRQVMLYHYTSPYRNGPQTTFFPDEVIHIQGLTSDGVWGYPIWEVAKNTIGQGLAIQKHGNKSFANGARPSGVLKTAGRLSPDARGNLRGEWESFHGGTDNSGRVAILQEGVDYQVIAMSNIDAQWVDGKKLSNVDAARLFNLPPYKLGEMDSSGNRANMEEQNETYKQMTLTRPANRMSQEFARKLLTDAEHRSGRLKFVPKWEEFLKPDPDTLTMIADRNIKATMWSPNEGRKYIGYPPRDGGDEYGSPAINPNPKRPEDGKESPDNGRPPGSKTENAHRELLLDRILHLLEREGHNLTRAATNTKNFLEWLDDFYVGTEGTQSTFTVLAESITGPGVRASCTVGLDARGIAAAVSAYAKNRHSQIVEACSSVTKTELPAVIERLAGENTTLIAQGLLATALGGIYGTENN